MTEHSWSTCSRCNTLLHITTEHDTVTAAETAPGADALHPQPPPSPESIRDVLPLVMQDYEARIRYYAGPEHYGVPLRIDNLRDHLRDAYAEALDQTGYLKAAMVLWDEMRATMEQVHRLSTRAITSTITDPWEYTRSGLEEVLRQIQMLTEPYQDR